LFSESSLKTDRGGGFQGCGRYFYLNPENETNITNLKKSLKKILFSSK